MKGKVYFKTILQILCFTCLATFASIASAEYYLEYSPQYVVTDSCYDSCGYSNGCDWCTCRNPCGYRGGYTYYDNYYRSYYYGPRSFSEVPEYAWVP